MKIELSDRQIEIIHNMLELIGQMPTGVDELLECEYKEWRDLAEKFE